MKDTTTSQQWHGGKGSKPRPTNLKKYQDEFDRIFGHKEKQKDSDNQEKTYNH